jgi:hypothetical protein
MDPRAVAGAAPHERVLPLAHQSDLVVDGARAVEGAVAQDRAAGLEDRVLDVPHRRHPGLRPRPRHRVQRVLLGLHPAALADPVPAGVALRHEMGDADDRGRGQQVVCPLGTQPVGEGEPAVRVLDVRLACVCHRDRGHLVHDHVRLGGRHRHADRRGVQPVHHDPFGAQLVQEAQLGLARRRRRHLVAPGHELRHQPLPQDAAPACHEYAHDPHSPDFRTSLTRRRNRPPPL